MEPERNKELGEIDLSSYFIFCINSVLIKNATFSSS